MAEPYIEIVGQHVRTYDRTLTGEYKLEDITKFIETYKRVTSPVLPDRTVLFDFNPENPREQRIAVAVQMDAQVRTLRFGGRGLDKDTVKLSLPYTIFIVTAETGDPDGDWSIENKLIFWSNKPITSYKDRLIPALTPNVYEDGTVCGGGRAPTTNTLKAQVDKFVNEWYMIDFSEVGHNRRNAMPWLGHQDFDKWIEMTETNPRGWVDWPEFDPGQTNQTMTTVEKAMGIVVDRDKPWHLEDGIKDLTFNPTFGKAEEWVAELTDTQVTRLKAALDMRGITDATV